MTLDLAIYYFLKKLLYFHWLSNYKRILGEYSLKTLIFNILVINVFFMTQPHKFLSFNPRV